MANRTELTQSDPKICEVTVDGETWDQVDVAALCERAARAVMEEFGLAPVGYQISVLACDDSRISSLNSTFRGKAKATNVLSWPSEVRSADRLPVPGNPNNPLELGDIAISFETTMAEAGAAGLPFADHVLHLLVHAILHLLGYDHEDDRSAALMEATESRILASLGVPDPY